MTVVVFPGLQCDMMLVIASIGSEGLLGTEALQSCFPHQLDLLVNTSQEEVANLIRAMDSSKANGPDEISIKLLQMTNPVISGSLAKLFNNSFTQGKVASKWKQANVTPVYKKGDRQIITNYRPISLISVLGKLQEIIVFKSLFKFLSQNKLLTWHNSGFKPMDSAMNQLILVTHKIYTAIDNGQYVSIALLDISKAFDRVWHRGLVNKLKTIGIRGQLLKWLTDYLENRCQRVVINGVQSPWLTIKAGVPQGSILGPLLFLVYVNDIVTNITSDIYLYADDTILMRIVHRSSPRHITAKCLLRTSKPMGKKMGSELQCCQI